MASVELHDVGKKYGSAEVISNMNLSIDDGSFTVFVGPSGCGKSTLLRMIAGLEPITAGAININGVRVNDKDPIERGVAMVFQNYALYPHMTVRKNIGFSLRMAGLSKDEIDTLVTQAASTLQIEPLLDRKPAQLSGGQRQRVAIGRAIVRDPEVFLFDEPLSNLDAELRVSMRLEIAKLHRRLGATMIYVTHDQTEAMTLADKIVVLRDGVVEQVGTPEELYDHPNNEFVAGFIGSPRMNFLSAQVSNRQIKLRDGTVLSVDGLGDHSGDVQLGVRPEHVQIGSSNKMADLKVDVVENLGGTRYLYGTLSNGTALIVEARDTPGIKAGDTVPLEFPTERLHVFDQHGQNLTRPAKP
ncbi:sugar ABC transporter ATP-binding protein [Devosia pacifica]|uniref:Sugar ABC transporter ATP-binding protein n=1 Tax=Devosia pacifica TaxID=1335967 RepID=A0A918S2F2_9HYPH|nr:sn-glycerol-3-phosphate ABC transporter ATP-binding protein UgpC [Devosia pacifica]GHA21559.1 sugar ABC transporter ATP-binding protein [Devosia pacifica]